MREERATKQAVEAAIKQLEANGAQPTANRILEITGGSKSTVLRHMKELGHGIARRTGGEDADDVLPAVLLEKAKPFIKELMEGAAEIERAKYYSLTERYHRNMEDFESALEEDGKRIEALTAQNTDLVAELAAVRDALELATLERDELEEKVKGLERRAREAEVRVMEVEAVNKSLELAANSAADIETRMLKLIDERLKGSGAPHAITA
jgi:predicted RNase H-like nuclease (RuvC/YqgF family)